MNKIRVKMKRKRFSIKKMLILIIILLMLVFLLRYVCSLKIRNIYIINNNILSDKEIIDIANLSDYPSFILTSKSKIKKSLEDNDYINSVVVKKKFWGKIYITVKENKVLCKMLDSDLLILSDGKKVNDDYNILSIPYLVSDISSIYDKFVAKFSLVDEEILEHISLIEYSATDVDDERFLLSMDDGNSVYITLSRIEKLNKYESIYANLNGSKGIIYLDLGDYVEVKS